MPLDVARGILKCEATRRENVGLSTDIVDRGAASRELNRNRERAIIALEARTLLAFSRQNAQHHLARSIS